MNCLYCKCEFTSSNIRKILCSQKCRNSLRAEKIRLGLCKRSSKTKIGKICIQCGKLFLAYRNTTTHCSQKCAGISKKKYFTIPDCLDNPKRKIDKILGYVRIYVPMHREANTRGYVYEHRVIAEQMIGRDLLPGEVVHHKNHIRWDNRVENLEVMDAIEHSRKHATNEI